MPKSNLFIYNKSVNKDKVKRSIARFEAQFMDLDAKTYLIFQINRKIKNFGKNCLVILEDNRDDINNSPDLLYCRGRKKVLDQMNALLRELEEDFKYLDINIKK